MRLIIKQNTNTLQPKKFLKMKVVYLPQIGCCVKTRCSNSSSLSSYGTNKTEISWYYDEENENSIEDYNDYNNEFKDLNIRAICY